MKLKKQIKVFLVFILLCGMMGSIYSFNRWFFAKYKSEKQNIEVKEEQREGKEIINDFKNPIPDVDKEPTNKEETTSTISSKKNSNKKRASEIYYCSDGDRLEGTECITKSETDALKMQVEDTRDYYEIKFNFETLAITSGMEETEIINLLKETCEEEIKGVFEENTNNSKEGSCIFTNMEEDKTIYYKCLDSSYTLKETKCIKDVKIPAKVRYGCEDGYKLEGIYCVKE